MQLTHSLSRFAFATTALVALTVDTSATTYYWKPGTTQGLWTSLSNWSTEAVDGADAAALPSSSDSLYNTGDYNFDLDGGSYTLTSWPTPDDWNNHYLTLANGTLTFTGEVSTHSGQINVNSDGNLYFPSGSSLVLGIYTSAGMLVSVNNGGSVSIGGSVRLYSGSFAVANGGSMTFAPSSLRYGADSHAYALSLSNAGTLTLPNGFAFTRWDISTVDTGSTFALTQTAGTLNLGGPIANAPTSSSSKPGPFSVIFSGGTVNATGDVTFDVTSVSVQNAVTFNVSASRLIDLTPATFAAGSSITKTGSGSIKLPTTAPTAAISGGALLLDANTYDLSSVTFAAGTGIALSPVGGRVDSSDSSIANATFTATIPATAGAAVFHSTDPSLLAKVRSDLAGSVPSGFELVASGDTLSVEAETSASFTVTGDILGTTGWGGTVPAAGLDVAIDGNGVVATLSSGTLPAWNSIEVKNGATLRIEANAALPAIILNKNATLEVAGNATVSFASLTGAVATSPSLVVPVVSVASGATLNVLGGMKFSNVNIDLEGTLAVTTTGGVTFGYASAGETTYIGFTSNGGTISLTPGSGTYNTSPLEFCCPASGGTVNAVGSLALIDTTILPVYERSDNTYPLTVDYQIGFNLGVNNPANALFEVVFDNTHWGVLGTLQIKGGATFRLANGGIYQNFESIGYWGRYAQISENGKLIVGPGCEFRLNALGDYGSNPLEVNPSSVNHPAIVVEDGGVFENYRFSGNGKGVFIASNSVYRIYQPNLYNEHYSQSSGTTTIYDTANIPFMGFAAVELADDSTLTFSTRNKVFWDDGQFDETSGDRVVTLADVPITGGGSITLSNANANVFGVIVKSGANTATGTASVIPPTSASIGTTTLSFANGANWAGTVIADGNVLLTNLVNATAPVAVSFGGMNLATNFTLRLWENSSCDSIAIGNNGWTGNGHLEFELVGGFSPGAQAWHIGSQPTGTSLPSVKGGAYVLSTEETEEGREDIILKITNGIIILMR